MLLVTGMCVKVNQTVKVIQIETVGSPRTKNAIRRNSANTSKRKSQDQSSESSCKPKKLKRLTNIEVSKFLVANKIRTETELMVVAKERNINGEGDVYSFIMNKSPKAFSDLIHTIWRLENAVKVQERPSNSQMEHL